MKIRVWLFVVMGLLSSLNAAPNRGCVNDGNSCFMNATLQALAHLSPLRDFLNKSYQSGVYSPASSVKLLIDHMNSMQGLDHGTQAPTRQFRDTFCPLKPTNMHGFGQHDAQEFFEYIAKIITEDTTVLQTINHKIDRLVIDQYRRIFDSANDDKGIDTLFKIVEEDLYSRFLNVNQLCLFIQLIIKDANSSILKTVCNECIQYYESSQWGRLGYKQKPQKIFSDDQRERIYSIMCGKRTILESQMLAFKVCSFLSAFRATLQTGLLTSPYELAFINALIQGNKDQQVIIIRKLIDKYKGENRDLEINIREEQNTLASLVGVVQLLSDHVAFLRKVDALFYIHEEGVKVHKEALALCSHKERAVLQTLPLSIPALNNVTLHDCLDLFKHSRMEGSDFEFYCSEHHKHVNAYDEYHELVSSPQVLCIQLKRFSYDFIRGMALKNSQAVSLPLELEMSPYIKDAKASVKYALRSLVVQRGSLNAGHYWAYAYDGSSRGGPATHRWYEYNDERVTALSDEQFASVLTPPNVFEQLKGALMYQEKKAGSLKNYAWAPQVNAKIEAYQQQGTPPADAASKLKSEIRNLAKISLDKSHPAITVIDQIISAYNATPYLLFYEKIEPVDTVLERLKGALEELQNKLKDLSQRVKLLQETVTGVVQ